jgi:hypothetical protein
MYDTLYSAMLTTGDGLGLVGLAGVVIIAALYFLPTIVAIAREKNNRGAIAVLNAFLGWTLIGWVLALVWAVSVDSAENRAEKP